MRIKQCPNCGQTERLERYELDRVQCSDCHQVNGWMFWVDVTPTKKDNRKERFIVGHQMKPEYFITNTRIILPLEWEVIDRGPDFEVWKGETIEERVLARFTHQHEADYLCRILRGE